MIDETDHLILDIVTDLVPPEKMNEALILIIERVMLDEDYTHKQYALLGILYGILGYGYRLGSSEMFMMCNEKEEK